LSRARLTYRNASAAADSHLSPSRMLEDEMARDWSPIAEAPYEASLQLAVIEDGEVYALVFPCCRTESGWSNVTTGDRVQVSPTHWRIWSE
jgi:hypothetical protein